MVWDEARAWYTLGAESDARPLTTTFIATLKNFSVLVKCVTNKDWMVQSRYQPMYIYLNLGYNGMT